MKNRVLVFPCGSEIGLELYRSLRFLKDFELFGASSTEDHGKFVYKNYIPDIPFVDNDDFINAVQNIVEKHDIDFIFPAHDSAVLKLAEHSDEINAVVVTSPLETCEIARSKKKTYETLKGIIQVPKMFSPIDKLPFPVFLKPEVGQGSKGIMKALSQEDVDIALSKDGSLLVLEYIAGSEYTVDCLTGARGDLLYARARERRRVSNGISVNSAPVDNEEFLPLANRINEELKFKGVWFFQVKRNSEGRLVLLEIAPRVAGTMALSRMRGVNLPLLSLYIMQDIDVEVTSNEFSLEIDRALENKYKLDITFDTVYVDFDDTIILDNSVNYLLIAFLYKMIENNKKLALITKHEKDPRETLRRFKIANNLFEEIIHINKLDEKCDYIRGNSVFIDDSFSERKKVREAKGIPVFGVSEVVELL